MCGRAYQTYTDEELAIRYLNKRDLEIPDLQPTFNLCPTQVAPVVVEERGERKVELKRWGLVPSWAKSVKDADKYSLINAKGEEIDQKRSFREPFLKRRCIVPVSGFYEWMREGKHKRPFAIHLKDQSIMSLAGIFEHWVDRETGEIVDSFAVVTTAANAFMTNIHNRMPYILNRGQENLWLDSELNDPNPLTELLKTIPNEALVAEEISTLVNSPKNNSPEVLKPIAKTL